MTTDVLSRVPETSPHRDAHPLDVFFSPESIAVIGATDTPDSVGRALTSNLIRSPFGGVLYPVSRRCSSVLGIRAYPSLAALPGPVELAIVATPASTVPDVLRDCAAAGVKGVIVLSAGFGDGGPAGTELEQQVRACLHGSSMRVLGSNSLGVACPRTRLNATFAPAMVPAGKVGFLSQSGALLTALLSQEHSARVGCSAFVSVGSLLDVGWGEWIDYLADDPETKCLGIYLERLDDARSFFAAAREVAPHKPVIVVKGGEGAVLDRGGDEVFEEACRCSGVLRVHKVADLFRVAALLSQGVTVKGRRLAIVSNARGPALLAAAALRADHGQAVTPAPETIAALGEILPARWDRRHPIDVGDDADAAQFVRATRMLACDPNTDALLVLLAPGSTIDSVRAAEGLSDLAKNSGMAKPVLACWMWGSASPESLAVLRAAGIATFHSPEAAVRTFGHLWRHTENLHHLAEINAAVADREVTSLKGISRLDSRARAAVTGTGPPDVLTEAEVRTLLAAYGLPVQLTSLVANEAEAVEAADGAGYPVLVELVAGDLLKEAAGETVRLEADDDDEVCRIVRAFKLMTRERFGTTAPILMTVRPLVPPTAVELAVRCTSERELGPVIRLGEGGRPGEPPRHAVKALAPLTPLTARELIGRGPVLAAVRARCGKGGSVSQAGDEPIDLDGLGRFLLGLSWLMVEQPRIKEITVNPLLVWDGNVIAGDVRVRLHDRTMEEEQLPRSFVARGT